MLKKKREEKKRKLVDARVRAEKHATRGSSYLRLPEGVPQFRPDGDKTFTIDVVPYVLTRPGGRGGNPDAMTVDGTPLQPGDLYYQRPFKIHRNVGIENETVVCPRTFGKPCPECQHFDEVLADPEHGDRKAAWKAAADFRASDRQVWAVIPHEGEYRGKVCVWDVSEFCFGKHLDNKVLKSKPEKRYGTFYDPEGGYALEITPSEESRGEGNTFWKYADITFVKREEPLEVDLDAVPDLDAVFVELSYKQFEALWRGEPADEAPANGQARGKGKAEEGEEDEDEDEENEAPAKKSGTAPATAKSLGITVGSTVEHEDYGTCQVTGVSKDGTSLTLEDEDEDEHKGISPADVELAETDEDDEETPAPKAKAAKKAPAVTDDEDDDADLEGEDDEDEDDLLEDEDEDEEEEEEEPEEDLLDEDLDDDDDEPAPKKKPPAKPVKKPGKR